MIDPQKNQLGTGRLSSLGKNLVSGLFLALVFLFGMEFYYRFQFQSHDLRNSNCVLIGGSQHHHFREKCEELVPTPNGDVTYSINEDGLRDLGRESFNGPTIAMLGDSKVEGWWLQREETLSASLERKLKPKLGWNFLNVGIRFSGPTIHFLRYQLIAKKYPIEQLLIFLNVTDVLDEKIADFVAEERSSDGVPTKLGLGDLTMPAWIKVLDILTLGKSVLVKSWKYRIYDRTLQDINSRTPSSEAILCRSLKALASLPLKSTVIFLPQGPNMEKYPYMGIPAEEASFEVMVGCAKKYFPHWLDLRSEVSNDPNLYWSVHRNMNAKGIEHLSALLAEKLEPMLGKARN